jgi:hypothetical protein
MRTKKIFASIITSFCGIVFIVSALTKLYPIEPLEFRFVDTGFITWEIAPFIARILIGFEFFLGVVLLLNLYLRNFTYRISIITLLFFVGFLFTEILKGNNDNCGCFGEYFNMTPTQAITKNVILLIALILSSKIWKGWSITYLNKKIIPSSLILISLSLPFILNTIKLDYSKSYLNKPSEYFKFPLDTLYKNAQIGNPPKTLSKGKHVFAFLSLTCPHCKMAAKKIGLMHKRNHKIHFFLILNGERSDISSFRKKNQIENIEYDFLYAKSFVYMAGLNFPAIFLVNNGITEQFLYYPELNQKEIEKWLDL